MPFSTVCFNLLKVSPFDDNAREVPKRPYGEYVIVRAPATLCTVMVMPCVKASG
jgi:hypothetical protein